MTELKPKKREKKSRAEYFRARRKKLAEQSGRPQEPANAQPAAAMTAAAPAPAPAVVIDSEAAKKAKIEKIETAMLGAFKGAAEGVRAVWLPAGAPGARDEAMQGMAHHWAIAVEPHCDEDLTQIIPMVTAIALSVGTVAVWRIEFKAWAKENQPNKPKLVHDIDKARNVLENQAAA